ncbi:MAG: phospholipid carrier-dependent glycosyltransferase [Anaerolineales bacterium]|nr:phospholipid carrier-dependent glycosyltransferase [Anaerolineales bacterium]
MKKFLRFLERYEIIIPFSLFILFLAFSLPGVNWGVPALWNPDEMVWRADSALRGELVFDETEPDFNYPSLPKYVMFAIGKIIYGMGYSSSIFFIAARSFSALLGAFSGVLIYYLARMIGANQTTSSLAGLLYIASGIAAANGRFAHNDLYLQFFAILCIYFAVKYQFTKLRLWIYASFFAVGLAASSKYTGGSLLLVPLFVLIVMSWNDLRRNWLQSFGILLLGGVLSFGGYVVGTPKALLSPVYYFTNVIPALQRYTQYGLRPSSLIGLYGQWDIFKSAVGTFSYFLFITCFIWFIARLVLKVLGKTQMEQKYAEAILILLVTLLIFDLPFLVSVNYIPRYFIPFVPFLSILGALFVKEIVDLAKDRDWKYIPAAITILLVVGISYSLLRLVSISLLFVNDARIPASEYIAYLRGYKKTVEYTLYPPIVNKKQFYGAARNYPIYFVKYPGEVVPTGGRFEYNQGEQGLIEREVDYLVIDTLTYSRFRDEYICQSNPVECDFFEKLLAGETSFRLIKEFKYSLPPYLPHVSISAVNPEIRIYERIP